MLSWQVVVVSMFASLGLRGLNTFYYLLRIFDLKLGSRASHGYDLNTAKENEWTLGQIFALAMLFALLFPAGEIYNSTL